MAARITPTVWYSLAAAWPLAFCAALLIYTMVSPPGNLSEPFAFVAVWSWRFMLVVSVALVLGFPLLARRLRASGRRPDAGLWVALGSLCISAIVQAFCEFALFKPIA
jgi:hypothetical protein